MSPELITIAKYDREWQNTTLVVCVFNNEDLTQVTWEQHVMEGDPKLDASQRIIDVPGKKAQRRTTAAGVAAIQPGSASRRRL